MDFDVEQFIMEIKNRPCIWNIKSTDYSNRILKIKMWEEVVEIFAPPDITDGGKKQLGTLLQKRWRNIRDSFVKECRRLAGLKSGSGAANKSQYLHFNQLTFLKNVVSTNKRGELYEAIEEPALENDNPEESFDIDIFKRDIRRKRKANLENDTTEESFDIDVFKRDIRRKRKANLENDTTEEPFDIDLFKRDIRKKRKPATRENDDASQIVDMLRKNLSRRNEDNDPDRHFLLSLLDDLKRVPVHLKLKTKIDVMKVIMDASNLASTSGQGHANSDNAIYLKFSPSGRSDSQQSD